MRDASHGPRLEGEEVEKRRGLPFFYSMSNWSAVQQNVYVNIEPVLCKLSVLKICGKETNQHPYTKRVIFPFKKVFSAWFRGNQRPRKGKEGMENEMEEKRFSLKPILISEICLS